MPTNKPLSYQSLLCVFQHMNDENRRESARFLPSLRGFQKLVPRNIERLVLGTYRLKIDEIEHEFKIFTTKIFNNNNRQPIIVKQIFSYEDLDQFGNKDAELVLTQGDIHIEDQQDEQYRHPGEGIEESFQRGEQNGNQGTVVTLYDFKDCRTNLAHHAELPQGTKIRDALRQQIQWSFNQKSVHKVKHLKIGIIHGVLRLPKGLQFKIRELSLNYNGNAVINAILPILEKSSFPLRKLSVRVTGAQDPILQNEVLRTSESLYIDGWAGEADYLVNLTNPNIHMFGKKIGLRDLEALARNWIRTSRRIGSKFSCSMDESILMYLERLKEQLQAVETRIPSRKCNMFPICNTVRMNSTSEINIYGFESANQEQEIEGYYGYYGKPYMIVMEVMPIGSAQPIN